MGVSLFGVLTKLVASLLLVVRPGAPNRFIVTSSDALAPSSVLAQIVKGQGSHPKSQCRCDSSDGFANSSEEWLSCTSQRTDQRTGFAKKLWKRFFLGMFADL